MDLVQAALNNPLVMGILQKKIADFIKVQLKGLDSSHFEEHWDKYLHIALMVLSGLTAFLKMVIDHQAGNFDPSALIQYVFSVYASTITAHEVSNTVLKKK